MTRYQSICTHTHTPSKSIEKTCSQLKDWMRETNNNALFCMFWIKRSVEKQFAHKKKISKILITFLLDWYFIQQNWERYIIEVTLLQLQNYRHPKLVDCSQNSINIYLIPECMNTKRAFVIQIFSSYDLLFSVAFVQNQQIFGLKSAFSYFEWFTRFTHKSWRISCILAVFVLLLFWVGTFLHI